MFLHLTTSWYWILCIFTYNKADCYEWSWWTLHWMVNHTNWFHTRKMPRKPCRTGRSQKPDRILNSHYVQETCKVWYWGQGSSDCKTALPNHEKANPQLAMFGFDCQLVFRPNNDKFPPQRPVQTIFLGSSMVQESGIQESALYPMHHSEFALNHQSTKPNSSIGFTNTRSLLRQTILSMTTLKVVGFLLWVHPQVTHCNALKEQLKNSLKIDPQQVINLEHQPKIIISAPWIVEITSKCMSAIWSFQLWSATPMIPPPSQLGQLTLSVATSNTPSCTSYSLSSSFLHLPKSHTFSFLWAVSQVIATGTNHTGLGQ